jgi:hypothetical protein
MVDVNEKRKRVRFGDVVRLVKETCKDPGRAGIGPLCQGSCRIPLAA